MYTTISEFIAEWDQESAGTQKIMDTLTDESLKQMVSPEGRSLGAIAWHIVTSTPGMMTEFGVSVELVDNNNTVPSTAKEIAETFRKVSADGANAIKQQWTDESLKEIQNVFGMKMPKAVTLSLLVKHIIHHRGQLTVLMRQAGLKVPGVYGPSKEEWSQMGMSEPVL